MSSSDLADRVRTVTGSVNYAIPRGAKPRFHAKDSRLDNFDYDPHEMSIIDARSLAEPPRLDREGFALMRMPSAVTDFRDLAAVNAVHPREIETFVADLNGADAVVVTGPATLRFGEGSLADQQANSKAARLIHSDTSVAGGEMFTGQANPHPDRKIQRVEHHNIWRTFSAPPQDLPLALCDFRSVAADDVLLADAAFDNEQGDVTWSFEAFLFRYNPRHRWHYFPNMQRDEVLLFKRYDSDQSLPWFVPHTAFADSSFAGANPRASIEMRTISFWYE